MGDIEAWVFRFLHTDRDVCEELLDYRTRHSSL